VPQVYAQLLSGVRAERPRAEVPDKLPLELRSAVRGCISRGRFRPPWAKRIVLIKWVIHGAAAIRVAGRRIAFRPGHVAVHVPSLPHEFWQLGDPSSEMCWFSADGPLAEEFVHTLGLRPGVYDYGPAPIDRVDEMTRALADGSPDGRRASSMLAIRMLYDVAAHVPPPPVASLVRQVRHLIREGLADPDLSAAGIATKLNYHRGSLSRAFHAQTGVTILDCITQTRLHEAELLLQHGDERIAEVARKCGFPDGAYFTRWVKRHTGRLPSQIRRSAAVGGV